MRAQALKQEVIANNLANADTVGYAQDKLVISSFHDVLMSRLSPSSLPVSLGSYPSGATTHDICTIHGVGPMETTGNPLDIALPHGRYLGVETPYGTRYTRRGDLQLSGEGFLTVAGYRVLGTTGPIRADSDSSIYISQDGSVMSGDNPIAALDIVEILGDDALVKEGNSLYRADPYRVSRPRDTILLLGTLEKSSVDPISEMINLIQTMRVYEAAQRAIKSHDDALDQAVNRVGLV